MLGGRDGRALQLQAATPIPLIKCLFWMLGGRDGRSQRLLCNSHSVVLFYSSTYYYYTISSLIHCYVLSLLCMICLIPVYLLSDTLLSYRFNGKLGKGPRPLLQYPKGPSMAEPIGPLRFMASPGQYYSSGDPANHLREDNAT